MNKIKEKKRLKNKRKDTIIMYSKLMYLMTRKHDYSIFSFILNLLCYLILVINVIKDDNMVIYPCYIGFKKRESNIHYILFQ